MRRLFALSVPLLAMGCSSPAEKMSREWESAGNAVSKLEPASKGVAGGKCSAGTAANLDVTLCEFDSAEAAKKAEEPGFALIQGAVGSSVSAGKMLLVIVDQRKVDPNGKKLNELVKQFREKMQ
jgi:hypothetical protein